MKGEGFGSEWGAGEAPDVLLDSDGGRWRVTEDALVGPKGRRLSRVNGGLAYWFAWTAFHPHTTVFVAVRDNENHAEAKP